LAINPSPSPVSLGGSVAGQSVALELSLPPTNQISLNDTLVRQLALRPSGQISMSDFYNRATFENGDFSNGLNSWTLLNNRIWLGGNGGNTTILGYSTPSNINGPSLDAGAITRVNVSPTFRSAVKTGGGVSGTSNWAELEMQTVTIANSFGVMYGPAVVSQYPVLAAPGDRVVFDWAAFSSLSSGSTGASLADSYDVFGYIIDPSQSGRTFTLIDATAPGSETDRPWGTTSKIFGSGEGGIYYFVFIAGSYDRTGGRVMGARLGVTNIKLERAGTY
jgi:hypothetical protein